MQRVLASLSSTIGRRGAAAALALAAAGVITLTVVGSPGAAPSLPTRTITAPAATTEPSPAPEPSPATTPAESWSALPAAPIGGRSGHTVVWTGSEVLVWAGWDPRHEVEGLSDGAAYDPATRRWRRIARAPVAARAGAAVAWTGEEVLLYGGGIYEGTIGDGAAYRPATDTWRRLPASPLGERAGMAYAWTGERLLIWGGTSGYGESTFHADGAGYDPATNRWTRIARAPIEGRYAPAFAWTGSEMIVWGGSGASLVGGEAFSYNEPLTDGAAYDPATDSWRRLPRSPLEGRFDQISFWTGSEMAIVGGHAPDREGNQDPFEDGAAYDPASGAWRRLAWRAPDRNEFRTAWTGRELILWGGYRWAPDGDGSRAVPVAEGEAFDPATGGWRTLPRAPIEPRYGHGMVWTGDALFVWGGLGEGEGPEQMRDDGALYVPPSI